MHGAQRAIATLHGRQNINNDATMEVDIVQTCALVPPSPREDIVVPPKRHKFSSQDKTYLEEQFATDPYPSAENRARFAAHLSVPEKQIQTWFNNKRQRAKDKSGPKSTPLTRRSLDDLSLVQSSSQSPIERFTALPPGSEGEPSVEVIEAAIKERLAMENGQDVASLSYSVSDDSSVRDETGQITFGRVDFGRVHNDQDSTSLFSAGGGSRSSQSHSSAFSSASNASHVFRRKNKLAKRRSGKTFTPSSMAKSTSILNKADNQKPSVKRPHSSSEPSLLIAVELDCIRCHTSLEHKIKLGEQELPKSMRCPQCSYQMGLYVGKSEWDAKSFHRRVQSMCGNCHKRPTVKIGNHSELEKRVEQSPLGRSAVCYVCKYCRAATFSIVVHKRCVYECTICLRKFQSKFAWERHESTAHEPQVAWICCRTSEYKEKESPLFSFTRCIFCEDVWPTAEHQAKAHGIRECVEQPLCRRIFFRKDQLSQHIRHFHHASMSQEMAACWKFEIKQSEKTWHCGICGGTFNKWDARMKHIGQHWNSGLTMKSWNTNGVGVELTADLQDEYGDECAQMEESHSSIEVNMESSSDPFFEVSDEEDPTYLRYDWLNVSSRPEIVTRGTVSKWWSKVKRMLPGKIQD